MLAITLEQVKLIGTVVSTLFVALSAISAWMVKTVAKKVAFGLLFAVLAVGVWSQRAAVTSCANDVKSNALASDTTCTFFGIEVGIPTGAGR